jgi:hypothetical protein
MTARHLDVVYWTLNPVSPSGQAMRAGADSASGGFFHQIPPLLVPRRECAGQAACRWSEYDT